MFLYFCIIRLMSIWLVQTWYVPDEYWQSLEVAHRLVFGYGYLTWEWTHGIRSYIHPLIIAAIYKVLDLLSLDYVYLLVLLPRVAQAILSAYSDYCFYKWCGRRKWAAFGIMTSWFWFYTASRTLINTLECSLTTIALSLFPWKGTKIRNEETCFLWIVALLCAIRPTAVIQWLPICIYHIVSTKQNRGKLLLTRYFPIGAIVLLTSIIIDSICNGSLLISQWNFLEMNLFNDVGAHYGSYPWYWYISIGLPTTLGVYTLPFLLASFLSIKNWRSHEIQCVLLGTILFTISIYSFISHKEFRFILSLLPMCLYLSCDMLSRWSCKAVNLLVWAVAFTLLLASAIPAIYLGYVHQQGTLEVMNTLQDLAQNKPNDTRFLFLMPCHSTPLYSHIHVNVSTHFLTCEPNFSGKENYEDEADIFYKNPAKWLVENYPPNSQLPSHIIHFDHLYSESSVFKKYKKINTFFHLKHASGRVGENVIVHQHIDY